MFDDDYAVIFFDWHQS
jgi:hypothetical protein